MKTHQLSLNEVQFNKIVQGNKTIESRLYDQKRQKIRMGDRILFTNRNDSTKTVTVHVRYLHRYNTFFDLFEDRDPQLFGGTTTQQLLEEIRQFYSYEDEMRFGVVGIQFDVVDTGNH